MKIVVAPDKFKGALPAEQVARAMAHGLRTVAASADIDLCPMADGGEGTVAALVAANSGRIVKRRVCGPLTGMAVEAEIGLIDDGRTAVIEMASASGLHLLRPEQRNPLRTTSFGTGQLLRAACDLGARRIILGIGGSATVDGGLGCLQAWGAAIELENGAVYTTKDRKLTGADVGKVMSVSSAGQKRPRRARAIGRAVRALPPAAAGGLNEDIEIVVACDVANPLFGANGAAPVFGPQKGATPQQVRELDWALHNFARRTGHLQAAEAPGAGAAGGLGFAMLAFFNATLRSGIEIVIEATRLRRRLEGADLCLTGEGCLDLQSLAGKTAIGVGRLCREMGVPCIALAGAIGEGAAEAFRDDLTAQFAICDRPMTLEQAMARTAELLATAAANVLRTFAA